jgi:hypothetical protein
VRGDAGRDGVEELMAREGRDWEELMAREGWEELRAWEGTGWGGVEGLGKGWVGRT